MIGRWKDIFLMTSVTINIFMIGAAMTLLTMHATLSPAAGLQRAPLRVAASVLDPKSKAALLNMLKMEGETIQTETRSARTIRDQAWASLSLTNFDPEITKKHLEQARELNVLARTTIENAVVDFAAKLSFNERSAFGQAIRHALSHPRSEAPRPR